MSESQALRIARQRVRAFEESDVMTDHGEALDCRDCEAFLQLGIDAYHWLIRADQGMRQAVYSGRVEYDPETDALLRGLFKAWLAPCGKAERWLADQDVRGYTVDNQEEFTKCREEVEAIVESFSEDEELPLAMATLQDRALDEFRNGQTAACF